jgi:hypothetical protein
VHQVGDLLNQAALATLLDLVGKLGDDDRLLALTDRLYVRAGLHPDATATGLVGLSDARAPEDDPAGGEVRTLDVLHQALGADRWVVDVGNNRLDRLSQVVGRDVGRHPDGDAGGAVDE